MPEGQGQITSYRELVDSITRTLARRDLAGDVGQWIASTELELFRDCNVRPGDQILSGTFVGGETSITLPYATHRVIKLELLDGTDRRYPEVVTLDRLSDFLEEQAGTPLVCVQFGNQLQLAPAAAAGLTYRVFYYGMPAPLSETNQTNQLFEIGWDAYLYGSLLRSAPFIGNDERIQTWAAFYSAAKKSVKEANWRARIGGGPVRIRPDFMVNDAHLGGN